MNLRIPHVGLAIVAIPILIFLSPFVEAIHGNMMDVALWAAVIFAVLAATRKALFDVVLGIAISATFMASKWLFPSVDQRTLALRTAAVLSFAFLNLVLLIGPWSRFSPRVRTWYKHRRHLGVATFFLALLHFSLIFSAYFAFSFTNAFMAFFIFFGFTALFIMFFLALTSWDWQQKHVGINRWKKIHLAVFLLYLLTVGSALRISFVNAIPVEPSTWVALTAFFVFWILSAPWGLAPRMIKLMNGWKQLHVLVHVAYLSVVLHVWLGVVFAQPMWVKVVFWLLALFTWGSHAAGWIVKSREQKKLLAQAQASRQIQVEGKNYWSVGSVDQFEEGKGKKFLVKNNPIAVFRYKEKFFGLYGVCSHQKGPIHQGKIVNGYVECPWHRWQFSTEDGKAPPQFGDRLAFFPCVVQEGVVYVSEFPKRAG